MPLKIESEYRAYLEDLWKEYAPDDLKGTLLVFEEQKLRQLMTDDDREGVDSAFKDATEQTLWERITKRITKMSPITRGSCRNIPVIS